MELGKRIKQRREYLKMSQESLAQKLGYKSRSSINKIELGLNDISQSKIMEFAKALDTTPSYLMGWDTETDSNLKLHAPTITDDYVTFPVIGEIAAGFESMAVEDWSGEKVDVPASYLKGREIRDFFVLGVKGNSMFPEYREGDKVLILKQSTLNYSGQVGAIIYNDDYATLKKVEYKDGEDWMNLVPINPSVETQRIEGVELERCKVLGIPRLLIRDIKNS